VIVEKFHDEKGILRPTNVAPFEVVIIAIGDRGLEEAQKLYQTMSEA
jgi:prolyl-tRNA synthetase